MTDRRPWSGPSRFDSAFLVFSTGWVSIAMTILLMYLYETHFGSLYLHIGLISSLFMAGLTLGAVFVGVLIARWAGGRFLHGLLVGILVIHASVLVFFALGWVAWTPGHGPFALAFVLSGLCCGGYWPIAAAQLAAGSLNSGQAGSRLETADHLGACLGGLATSLLMVPVLGTKVSLLVLIALVMANFPAAIAGLRSAESTRKAQEAGGFGFAGYALFGICACLVLCSNVLVRASERYQPTLPAYAVNMLAGEHQTRHASATLSSGRRADYVTIIDMDQKPAGYVFSSADFAPEVRGFGGRLNLAVYADASGRLVDLLVVRSNETPSYLDSLRGWLDSFNGKTVFGSEALAGVNAVAGATVSSEAVLAAVRTSGRQFAVDVLKSRTYGEEHLTQAADLTWPYLVATALLAFTAIWHGHAWGRILVLVLTFLLGGVYLECAVLQRADRHPAVVGRPAGGTDRRVSARGGRAHPGAALRQSLLRLSLPLRRGAGAVRIRAAAAVSAEADARSHAGGAVHQIPRARRLCRRVLHREGSSHVRTRSAHLGVCLALGLVLCAGVDARHRGDGPRCLALSRSLLVPLFVPGGCVPVAAQSRATSAAADPAQMVWAVRVRPDDFGSPRLPLLRPVPPHEWARGVGFDTSEPYADAVDARGGSDRGARFGALPGPASLRHAADPAGVCRGRRRRRQASRRGRPTDADSDRAGPIVESGGGTLPATSSDPARQ